MGDGIGSLVAEATEVLTHAGVSTPRVDSELLAAHLLGVPRTQIALAAPSPDFADRFRDLVAGRARRIPLQHLTGTTAFGPVALSVGPGVFIPRPETESLFDWAATRLTPSSTVVDLCTGSGALAVALAHVEPSARVIGVELSRTALGYARRNIGGTAVELVEGDVSDPELLTDLAGSVDLIVANPPYIPDGAQLEPEVVQHDPHQALFGGPDGLDVIAPLVTTVGRLLKAGGVVGVEHDDSNGARTAELFTASGRFDDIRQRRDLAGCPRFVTARRID